MYVELKNINKTYGSYQASKNVNFGIEKGKLIGLLGPSGSGKTTILRMIAGLETPDSGEIIIDGKVVNDVPASERGIGFVFQNYALMKSYTVFENVELPLLAGRYSGRERKKLVNEMLEFTGIRDLADKKVTRISGGEQQRCAIARLMVAGGDLILADEPTGALDHEMGIAIMELLEMLNKRGKTLIVITHDQEIGSRDRVIRLADGQILEEAK